AVAMTHIDRKIAERGGTTPPYDIPELPAGFDQVGHASADQLARMVAELFEHTWRRECDRKFAVDLPDPIGDQPREIVEPLLGEGQGEADPPELPGRNEAAHDPERPPLAVADHHALNNVAFVGAFDLNDEILSQRSAERLDRGGDVLDRRSGGGTDEG